ncbi:DUF2798 domain-containing protein [Rhizobium sp. C4]|uniref:DUF2798 domain-containing protein n=1 Tax=Rhizobium sp. C4 TaxID=1349800 RepID=UPI001E354DB4|nr:DUF2798 domain-containing protein [Rhizobium sp. C4]MCD2174647.1 DUF2798 domain-containing protein [Rhizobium sp. C4]
MTHQNTSRGAKLPARYAAFVMPLFLSIVMTFVVSAISTLKSLGFNGSFLTTWPVAWGLSWLVAFPTLLLVLPIVRWLVGLVVEAPGRR